METQIIVGGFMVPKNDTHLSVWAVETQRLDHDRFLTPFACEFIHEGDVVIDAGACFGDHTIAYSKAVGDKGQVVAIEAGPVFECLKHNVGLFPNKNTYALHAALSETCGESVQHLSNENIGASICQDVPKDKLVKGNKYLLTVTLDYIAQELEKRVDFIKLDIEGYECKALIGATRTLKDKPKMLIEVNEAALMLQGDTVQDLCTILAMNNYEWKIVQPQCTETSPIYDILATPKP